MTEVSERKQPPGHELKKPKPDENYPAHAPHRVYPGDPNWKTTPAPQTKGAPPPNFVITPDYRVLLNENFAESNVNMMRWWTRYVYQDGTLDYLNDEWERFREDGNHVCDGNILKLTALPHNGDFWPSGMIRSKDTFAIADGNEWYFEARLKVPAGLGVWPAFWLAGIEKAHGDDSTAYWPPEIDILELVNNGGEGDNLTCMHCNGVGWDEWQNNTWVWWHDTFNTQWCYWQSPHDFSKGFHTFSLWYCYPNYVIYCDRHPVLQGTYNWNDWEGKSPGCYVLCNLAIGGGWAGRNGVDDSAMPQSLDVDYIRVYQRVRPSTVGHDLLPR